MGADTNAQAIMEAMLAANDAWCDPALKDLWTAVVDAKAATWLCCCSHWVGGLLLRSLFAVVLAVMITARRPAGWMGSQRPLTTAPAGSW